MRSGKALIKFRQIIAAQGGDDQISSSTLKLAPHLKVVTSDRAGKIKDINNYNLNTIAKILGAAKDKLAGIYLLKKLDEEVDKNEPIMRFYSSDKYRLKEAEVTFINFPIYKVE